MKIESKKIADDQVQIDVKVDKQAVDKQVNEIASGMASRARIKGFRQGKAPLGVIKSQFNKEILAEATTRLVYEGTAEALKEKGLRNVSNPVLADEFRPKAGKQYVGQIHLDGSFSFSITVEPPPDIEVEGYSGIEVEVDAKDFEGWVKKKLKEQQMLYGSKVAVERPARIGDELVVDFEGFLEGQKPLEGGKEEGYRLLIGEENFLKEFEDSFIGHVSGDEFSVDVRFPDSYPQEDLVGKMVTFECALHEVSELVPHELDDELATMLSYESVDAMMEGHREMWDQQFAEPMRAQLFGTIMDELLKKNEFNVPKVWIDNEVENTVKRLSVQGLDQDPAMTSLRDMSERTVKIAYLLDKVYEKETSIHLSVEEFKEIAEKEAKKQGMDGGDKLIETIKVNGQYEGFVTFHEQQKTIDYLIENAIVTEKE